ncbi:MAG: response regulator [Prochlorothrix sp.]|nr:response regulator [Prochlorothrix sp.]
MTLKPITVMIVDDSQVDRNIMVRYLSPYQDLYTLVGVETGEEALEICRQCQPQLFMLDYFLPDYDGIDLFLELQKTLGDRMAPAILLTGHGDIDIVRETVHVGMQDYLVKDTVTPDLLHRTLTKVLEQWELQQTVLQQQIQQQLLANLALKISQSLQVDEILDMTVSSLLHALRADRVLILQFAADGTSTPIAEATQDSWPSCLQEELPVSTWVPPHLITDSFPHDIPQSHWQDPSFFATYPTALLNRWQVKSLWVVPIWASKPLPPIAPAPQVDAGAPTDSAATPAVTPNLPASLEALAATPSSELPLTALPQAAPSLPADPDSSFGLPWGLLMVHQCQRNRPWQVIETGLLQKLGVHLSIAIRQAELYRYQEQAQIHLHAQLQRQQVQAQALLQACPDLVVQMNREGRYLDFLNGRPQGVIQPPKLPLKANTVFDVLPSNHAQQYLHHIGLALDTQTLQVYQQSIEVEGYLLLEEVRIIPCGAQDEVLAIVRELYRTTLPSVQPSVQPSGQPPEVKPLPVQPPLAQSADLLPVNPPEAKLPEVKLPEA